MKKIFFLFIIITIAAFLRFYQLGINPPSLTWDEAAWGYNAYSLGIDGKDEFGRFLPLDYIESFGDFKPPVYAYLAILPIKVFGLNEFATRFPSAFLGVITVLISFFLVKQIFNNNKEAEIIAFVSSFLLAISPWHINLSRAAFEANVATFFIILGTLLYLKGVMKRNYFFILSVIPFVLSLYTFNTARVFVPLLVLFLSIGFRKKIFQMKKEVFVSILLGLLLLIPTAKFLISPQASLRFKEVNIFTDSGVVKDANQQIANDNNSLWSKVIHNRRIAFGREFLNHYFDNLNPDFLFIKGDGNPKFSTRDVGQLYIWEIPMLIIGVLLLFKRKEGVWWIIPIWLILGIIPAGTARETPHALRIETTLPTFQILTALGLVFLFTKINRLKVFMHLKYLLFSLILLLISFNFLYYYHGYYAHYPKEFSREWQYGYKESINYIEKVKNQYEKVEFTDKLGRPYIYFLFYTKYSPQKFREEAVIKRDVFGFVHVYSFNKYNFFDVFSPLTFEKNTLYLDKKESIPNNANIKAKFKLLNGEDVLIAYTT
ncbi:phospholipid carrier-dependent glycosyltransferase [Candidatus Microgenomates bacterium]|nr:MAG: phospholipid carrier-dependent glycosyltransferase [Candidatus Microgenomates bacterium]